MRIIVASVWILALLIFLSQYIPKHVPTRVFPIVAGVMAFIGYYGVAFFVRKKWGPVIAVVGLLFYTLGVSWYLMPDMEWRVIAMIMLWVCSLFVWLATTNKWGLFVSTTSATIVVVPLVLVRFLATYRGP